MTSKLRHHNIWHYILLSIALWTMLGLSKWAFGTALSDGTTLLLALVGGIPACLGLAAAGGNASRTFETAGRNTMAPGDVLSSACWSQQTSWPLGIPTTDSGGHSPTGAVASGTSLGQRIAGAGKGLQPIGSRGARTVRFICRTCCLQQEVDDLAVLGGTGKVMCLACHTRETGLTREMPASLVQAVRTILDDASRS